MTQNPSFQRLELCPEGTGAKLAAAIKSYARKHYGVELQGDDPRRMYPGFEIHVLLEREHPLGVVIIGHHAMWDEVHVICSPRRMYHRRTLHAFITLLNERCQKKIVTRVNAANSRTLNAAYMTGFMPVRLEHNSLGQFYIVEREVK